MTLLSGRIVNSTEMLFAAFILAIFGKCCCFNFDTDFVDIISIGSDRQYFGYSVLLQQGAVSSVIVGAPKANSTYPVLNELKQPGVVYRCNVGSFEHCQPYLIDQEGNTEHREGDSRYNYKNKKDGSMLGATLAGGSNDGDSFFVCSPRWVNEREDQRGSHYLANGMCYQVPDSRYTNSKTNKLMPLLNSGEQGYTLNGVIKYYFALGQAGFSADYSESRKEIVFGAPGVFSWKGTTIRYKDISLNTLPPQQRLIQNGREKRQVENKINIPNPLYNTDLIEESTYFGYAVCSGNFYFGYSDAIWYVASAPRAEELFGLVLLYEFTHQISSTDDVHIHKKLVGDQLGSYFGGSLLAIDTSNSFRDDLLVGAPTYYIGEWDEGCVYYYKNYDGYEYFHDPVKIFGRKQAGARFGTAISNIGDINWDSYQDVAISAPYEEELGVIYIYLGSRVGLSPEFSQRIVAKSIDDNLRGFGFSISKGVDIDHNLYNDLAVGAYRSGQVAIIKSRPIIKYFANLNVDIDELTVETSKFNVTYCVNYTAVSNNVNYVDTNIEIIKDSVALNSGKITQMVTITKGNSFCGNIEIMLKLGHIDYTKPFKIDLIYTISNLQSKEKFCSTCPVTDPLDWNSTSLTIPFANVCGRDNYCRPNLKISARFENDLKSLIIGSKTTIKLFVKIENNGDPGYLTQVHMKLPPDVEIARISSKCELSEDRIYHCAVDNILYAGFQRELTFDLDIKNLNPKHTNLTLDLITDSKGYETDPYDNSFWITLLLEKECNIIFGGRSSPDHLVYIDENNKIKYDVVNFTHEFSFRNLGPSPLVENEMVFYFPFQLRDSSYNNIIVLDIYEPEVLFNQQSIECHTDYVYGFYKEDINGETSSAIDKESTATALSRPKRNAKNSIITDSGDFPDLPLNRTLFWNCSSDFVNCMKIVCNSQEIIQKNQFISISVSGRLHLDILRQITDTKDIILMSSTAELSTINRTTRNYVKTVLIGTIIQGVSYWIYIVCVIVAVVILAIIIFVLYKLNFFNRPVREKLLNEEENCSSVKSLNDDDHDDSVSS